MNKLLLIIGLSALWLGSVVGGETNDSAEVQLKAATHLELVDGDLKAAIEQYKKITTNAGGNRSITAKALLQMGQCYEKLGLAEARHAYERVVRDFADQQERLVTVMRTRRDSSGGNLRSVSSALSMRQRRASEKSRTWHLDRLCLQPTSGRHDDE